MAGMLCFYGGKQTENSGGSLHGCRLRTGTVLFPHRYKNDYCRGHHRKQSEKIDDSMGEDKPGKQYPQDAKYYKPYDVLSLHFMQCGTC